MKIYFSSRQKAREFCKTGINKPKDLGKDAPKGKRWAVDYSAKIKAK